MATTESIEGTAGPFWFHYDLSNDVLYLRLNSSREDRAWGEETDDGFILLRSESDNHVIGVTIVNWWKRFGRGAIPDSYSKLAESVEPWAQRAGAAA